MSRPVARPSPAQAIHVSILGQIRRHPRPGDLFGIKNVSAATLRVTRRSALGLAAVLAFPALALAAGPRVLVYKNPECGCCSRWVRHLEAAGYVVTVEERSDMEVVRNRLGVPSDLAACHTAQIDGYIVEGHVPVKAIQRLLHERPDAIGVAVPGMPSGSPGMEGTAVPYTVMLFGNADPLSYVQSYMQFLGTDMVL